MHKTSFAYQLGRRLVKNSGYASSALGHGALGAGAGAAAYPALAWLLHKLTGKGPMGQTNELPPSEALGNMMGQGAIIGGGAGALHGLSEERRRRQREKELTDALLMRSGGQ